MTNAQKIILITKYDPAWITFYEREKAKILAAIGDEVQAIEHIGSTAVVGLAAKPVIDIMVAVKNLALTKKLIKPLLSVGYSYIPEYENELPERRFFHRGPSGNAGSASRHTHLHIVETDSGFWHDQLLFRDYLRRHKVTVRKYEELKKKLAIACGSDIKSYCDGKSSFIKSILQRGKIGKKKDRLKITRFRAENAKPVTLTAG